MSELPIPGLPEEIRGMNFVKELELFCENRHWPKLSCDPATGLPYQAGDYGAWRCAPSADKPNQFVVALQTAAYNEFGCFIIRPTDRWHEYTDPYANPAEAWAEWDRRQELQYGCN